MQSITIVSLMAANARPLYEGIASYLTRHAGLPATLVVDKPWQEQARMFDQGEALVGFVCGLPYTRKSERLELLAAPVLRAPRYGGRPVYFSDVVVRRASPFRSFADLRGARWAFNERGSFSGYVVVNAHLAALGEDSSYFGQVLEAGAHLRSLELVRAGLVDAAAIDSSVLELEQARDPQLAHETRVIAALGPNPIPPAVILRSAPTSLKQRLRTALLEMHQDTEGAAVLTTGLVSRFVAVSDSDYDAIRQCARRAESLELSPCMKISS